MKIFSTLLTDVLILKPNEYASNGSIDIRFSDRELANVGITSKFVQENESYSNKNVLRGLHCQIQHPQGKLIRVISGAIFDVIVDLRRSSVTFGKATSFKLTAENGLIAWVPPGHAHGFYVIIGHAHMLYSVTDYQFPEFERTLLWCDPVLGIKWPLDDCVPILSDKDAAGLLFSNRELYY